MIDEKINTSLKELEQGLQNVESARKQVEKTVKSFDGLNTTTTEFVSKLGIITTKIQELVDSIGKDYAKKVKDFEKDRASITEASNVAIGELAKATNEYKDSFDDIDYKLKFSLLINAFTLMLIIILFFILLK